ncbi:MAG: plasmid mobilization relaxosome protein MobC [Lachnospiraceae bacterium]|nr:plasmid mobilization relaxosome protein MobC [Lachnospiraceae bacterium]
MAYNRKRSLELHVFLNEEENEIFEAKFRLSGKQNKSDFLRQLILEGFVYEIDFSDIQRNNFLLSNISNNINQIAHRINETRNIHQSDIDAIRKEIEKLWQLQKSTLSSILSVKQ